MGLLGNKYQKLMDRKSSSSMVRLKVQESNGEKQPWVQLIPHILVVDDELLIRQQLERLYTHGGYVVAVASSAEQALDRL